MLPPKVIIPFDGNHADIPAGFSRYTTLDGKFPKGASSGFGNSGGATLHSHTITHTHTMAAHTHTIQTGGPIDGGQADMGVSGGVADSNHSHGGSTGAVGAETTGSTAASLASAANNNLPPYYEVVFIETDTWRLIPIDGMILSIGTRAGMTYHSASQNKFLRGAGANADAGGTGGNASHTHTQSHTHTAASHSHASAYTSAVSDSGEDGQSGPSLAHGHSHQFTVQTATQAINGDTTTSDSASSEPYHKTLKHYVATQAVPLKIGDIVMTVEATNPQGWLNCDGTEDTPDLEDFYIKNTSTANQTGGANTHTHTANHRHTASGTHTHTPNSPTGYSGDQGGHNGSGKTGRQSHRHNIDSVSSTGVNTNYDATTSSAVNNEPEYIKVRFIMATGNALESGGAMMFFNRMNG